MAFHPKSLSHACLKDLAKNLQKGAQSTLNHPIRLSQAQELLARTLGHPDWKTAVSTCQDPKAFPDPGLAEKVAPATPQSPIKAGVLVPSQATKRFSQSLEKSFTTEALSGFHSSGIYLVPEELFAADGVLMLFMWLSGRPASGLRLVACDKALLGMLLVDVSRASSKSWLEAVRQSVNALLETNRLDLEKILNENREALAKWASGAAQAP
jgi:hypothetical protein